MRSMENPLISIIVITYNSAKYVLETLESVRRQTYSNIELIITDDGSTDNTVEICRGWLSEAGKHFSRAELITSSCNTGIPANANRGYKIAQGKWIKGIAGDDVLKEDAIEQFLKKYDGDCYIVATSYQELLVKSNGEYVYPDKIFPSKKDIAVYRLPVEKQYKKILWYCFVPAPTTFLRRDLFEKVGYFDEQYYLMEDWPFWLKCIERGYKIDFLPIVTIYYRKHIKSVSSMNMQTFYNERFYQTKQSFIQQEICPKMSKWNLLFWEDYFVMTFKHFMLYSILKNKRNKLTCLFSPILSLFSLVQCYVKICKLISKNKIKIA